MTLTVKKTKEAKNLLEEFSLCLEMRAIARAHTRTHANRFR